MNKSEKQEQFARIVLGFARRLGGYDYLSPLELARRSSLQQLGWQASLHKRGAVDSDGNPIPWFSYCCIHVLDSRPVSGLNIFEYGMGNSTQYWVARGAKVDAVDHHKGWFEKISAEVGNAADLRFRSLDDGYVESIGESEKHYDIVVVDGRERVACSEQAANYLSSRGVIIWDNTMRDRYQAGMQSLLQKGFRKIDFRGITPATAHITQTSIFYRDNNALGL